jgi:hypothetical protein
MSATVTLTVCPVLCRVVVLSLLVLNGCASQYAGHSIPEACSDLSGLSPSVVRVDRLPAIKGMQDPYAIWTPHGIYIEKSAPAWVDSHELCHERIYQLTGNPAWHG